MSFHVLSNGKPADNVGFPEMTGEGWDCSAFDNLPDAQEYLNVWLGEYAPDLPLPAGVKFIYNQGGDWVIIARHARLSDRDADQRAHSGRLRHLAWLVQQTLIEPGGLGGPGQRHIVTDLLNISDEIAK